MGPAYASVSRRSQGRPANEVRFRGATSLSRDGQCSVWQAQQFVGSIEPKIQFLSSTAQLHARAAAPGGACAVASSTSRMLSRGRR